MTSDYNYRRVAGAAGIIAMALLVVGFRMPGSPPKADDSVQAISNFLTDKRGAILAGDFLIGLGSAALLVWFSGLRGHLEAAGRGDMLPRAAFAGGVVAAALNLAGAAVGAATVFKAAGLGDQNLNRALFGMGTDLFTIAGAAIAVLFGAASVSGGRTGALPRWASSTGMVVAVLQAVSCVGIFASSGFFASGGAFAFIAFVPAVAWVVAVSVVLLRGGGIQPATAT